VKQLREKAIQELDALLPSILDNWRPAPQNENFVPHHEDSCYI
jgi:hypothetical protein